MDTFFSLPSIAPANIAVKFAFVCLGCLLVWWLLALLLLQRKPVRRNDPRQRADLNVAICSFWAAVCAFPLLQIYTILELNYNLGDLGIGIMKSRNFYLAFIPEYLASVGMIGYILIKRKRILDSINLSLLKIED